MDALNSVITLTHNKLDVTRRCLPSLLEATGASWELIVVDNGSEDGTPEWLEAFRSTAEARGVRVKLVRNEINVGCSTSRNQGARAARGDRLVFVDNDVALRSRNWLVGLGSRLEEDARVAIVGPKLVYPWQPYRIQFAGGGVSPTGRVMFVGRGGEREDPQFNAPRDVQCAISACFMVRRSAFKQAGGFDEAFNPVEYEDIDLCYRVREHGNRVLYEPSVEMYHLESVTTAGTPTLPNTTLIIRHGLLFKERWRHMFENEDGPSDQEAAWRKLPPPGQLADAQMPLVP